MRALALLVLLLPACTFTPGHSLSTAERVAIACSSWVGLFETVTTRRELGLAKDIEIDAINEARPVLNPVCSAPNPSVGDDQLAAIEQAIILVIKAQSET